MSFWFSVKVLLSYVFFCLSCFYLRSIVAVLLLCSIIFYLKFFHIITCLRNCFHLLFFPNLLSYYPINETGSLSKRSGEAAKNMTGRVFSNLNSCIYGKRSNLLPKSQPGRALLVPLYIPLPQVPVVELLSFLRAGRL